MLILQFTREDYAGVGSKIREAFSYAGHECRLICGVDNYLAYPKDLTPNDSEIPALIDKADVIVAHNSLGVVRKWGKAKRFLYVHGTAFRKAPQRILRAARSVGAKVIASTVDLTRYGQEILYNPTPINGTLLRDLANPPPRQGLRIAHAPTSRKGKGTAIFLEACAGLDRVEPVLIEKKDNAECLRIKASCHATFESLVIGLQVSGVESMAMGHPVLTGGDDYTAKKTKLFFGYLPYIRVLNKDSIRQAILKLRNDQDFFQACSERSLKYIREVHDYPVAVERMRQWFL